MLAAGVILAIMIIPIISSITREVLTVVPQHQREAVLALGSTRWEMIRMGVLRNARAGIVGAIILGLGRALGETMAVTMVIGNRPEIAKSLFAPGYTMASVLANEFTEATGDLYLSALIEIGLALFLVTIVVNALARSDGVERDSGPAGKKPCLDGEIRLELQRCRVPEIPGLPPIAMRRRVIDHVMTALSLLTVVLVLVPLFAIFAYLVYKGIGSLNIAFLTQTPKPVGEPGGGMANAIVGSMVILAIASLMGVPSESGLEFFSPNTAAIVMAMRCDLFPMF